MNFFIILVNSFLLVALPFSQRGLYEQDGFVKSLEVISPKKPERRMIKNLRAGKEFTGEDAVLEKGETDRQTLGGESVQSPFLPDSFWVLFSLQG